MNVTVTQRTKKQKSVIIGEPTEYGAFAADAVVNIEIGSVGSPIQVGKAGQLEIPFNCSITGFTILEGQGISTSIVLDVRRSSFDEYPSFVPITGSEKPSLSNEVKRQDIDLTTWSKELNKGDIIGIWVDSNSTAQVVNLSIRLTKI